MAAGTPGWVGRTVELISHSSASGRTIEARVWLDAADHLLCDRPELLDRWSRDGVLGRSQQGRLFPRDGQRFLDELPFVYRTPYLSAVPSRGVSP